MIKWYSYVPIDTMYFKGSEPMEMGQNHTASFIFPPPPETIIGAIRSLFLKQHQVDINEYRQGKSKNYIYKMIGKPSERPPFKLIGPIFKIANEIYIPAPYIWYYEKEGDRDFFTDKETNVPFTEKLRIIKPDRVKSLVA